MSYATDRLIKNARVSLPGSLDDAILLELFNTMDSFFRSTNVWTEAIQFSVQPGDPVGTIYYIEPESVSTIIRLLDVTDANGFRQRAMMSIPGEVTFMTPPPNQEPPADPYIYTALVALNVVDPVQRDGYPEFPEWILEKYGLGILDGLLGRMMAQPAKPYTSKDLATAHMMSFRRAISHARTESIHANVANAQAWAYPQSFRTRSRR